MPVMKRPPRPMETGQAMAEFALVTPVLVLLLFGVTYAAFYTFRAASSDWGVFITGVAAGKVGASLESARGSVFWSDIAASIDAGPQGNATRAVRSQLSFTMTRSGLPGVNLVETHQGAAFFRHWQFYPGPPEGTVQ